MSKRIRSLRDAFHGDPRPGQEAALPEIEEGLRSSDVVVVDAPVGAGKSKIAEAIARWATSADGGLGSAGIGVPANALLDQYETGLTSPGWTFLRRRDSYMCHRESSHSCQEHKEIAGGFCKSPSGNRWSHDGCPWVRDLAAVRGKRSKFVTTWHGWMAHSLAPAIAIQDEAHGLVDFLTELSAKKLWRSKYHWPVSIRDVGDIERWVDSLPQGDFEDPALSQLRSVLDGSEPSTQLFWGEGTVYGKESDFISLRPMNGLRAPPVLWPSGRVEKVVLMSATLSEYDLEDMGLSDRRVTWVSVPSEIPEDNRPLILLPYWDSRLAHRDIEDLKLGIGTVLDNHPGERGVIHATYGIAQELRGLTSKYPRLMFHRGPEDKSEVLDRFLSHSAKDAVLVISGQYEGLDLAGDKAGFQILTGAPRQSLSDQSLRWLAENAPERYEWLTVRDLAQAYGRVCRGPEDRGVTICLDRSSARELRSPLVPAWMRGAIDLSYLEDLG